MLFRRHSLNPFFYSTLLVASMFVMLISAQSQSLVGKHNTMNNGEELLSSKGFKKIPSHELQRYLVAHPLRMPNLDVDGTQWWMHAADVSLTEEELHRDIFRNAEGKALGIVVVGKLTVKGTLTDRELHAMIVYGDVQANNIFLGNGPVEFASKIFFGDYLEVHSTDEYVALDAPVGRFANISSDPFSVRDVSQTELFISNERVLKGLPSKTLKPAFVVSEEGFDLDDAEDDEKFFELAEDKIKEIVKSGATSSLFVSSSP